MSEQLFCFSVLRAPGPGSDLSPIVMHAAEQRVDDRLADVVKAAVSWLKFGNNVATSK
jgi:hypothetical protein